MKKFIVYFIVYFMVMVLLITFYLIFDYKINKKDTITDAELMTYRNYVISTNEKYGYELTEEEINEQVQKIKEIETSRRDMNFPKAFKNSLFICSIFFVIFLVIGLFHSFHTHELYGK